MVKNIPHRYMSNIFTYIDIRIMGRNEKENFSFSFFFSFSFLGEKWRTRNEKLGFINKEFEIVVSMVSNYYL